MCPNHLMVYKLANKTDTFLRTKILCLPLLTDTFCPAYLLTLFPYKYFMFPFILPGRQDAEELRRSLP